MMLVEETRNKRTRLCEEDLASRVLALPAMTDAILSAIQDPDQAFDAMLACHLVARASFGPGELELLGRREAPNAPDAAQLAVREVLPTLRALSMALGMRRGGTKGEIMERLSPTLKGAYRAGVPPLAYALVRESRLARRKIAAEYAIGKRDPFQRITKGRALDMFSLKEEDLDEIPCDEVENPHYKCAAPMLLFERGDLEAAAASKHGSLVRAEVFRARRTGTNLRKVVEMTEAAVDRRQRLFDALAPHELSNPGALVERRDDMTKFCAVGYVENFGDLAALMDTFAKETANARKARPALEAALTALGVQDSSRVIERDKRMSAWVSTAFLRHSPCAEAKRLADAHVSAHAAKIEAAAEKRERRVAMRKALSSCGFGKLAKELDSIIAGDSCTKDFCGSTVPWEWRSTTNDDAASAIAFGMLRLKALRSEFAARGLTVSFRDEVAFRRASAFFTPELIAAEAKRLADAQISRLEKVPATRKKIVANDALKIEEEIRTILEKKPVEKDDIGDLLYIWSKAWPFTQFGGELGKTPGVAAEALLRFRDVRRAIVSRISKRPFTLKQWVQERDDEFSRFVVSGEGDASSIAERWDDGAHSETRNAPGGISCRSCHQTASSKCAGHFCAICCPGPCKRHKKQ
jgi:hypothetical protein